MNQAYAKLPLRFEVNAGQVAPDVRFMAHSSGYALYLGARNVTLALSGSRPSTQTSPAGPQDPATLLTRLSAPGPRAQVDGAAVQMSWVGGNPHPQVKGEAPLPGVVNYFLGNDPAKWRTNIATYAKVRYVDVYPGIDLVYYGSPGGQLEYDIDVRPGADPARIHLAYGGSTGANLDGQGNLQLHLANGRTLQQQVPEIYQMVGGARQPVVGGYRLGTAGQVSFQLGAYDHSLPLVIDPQYRYVTYLGGGSTDWSSAIAADSAGNAYVAGYTISANFPTTAGAFQTTYNNYDAYVTKFNASGTALLYSTYLGGSNQDIASGIAVDSSGNAYVAGGTLSTNFPTTAGALQGSNAGSLDGFVTGLNPTGAALKFSMYLGGSGDDGINSIAVDSIGDVFVAGSTSSTNFPTYKAFQASNGGGTDGFVTQLDSYGVSVHYSTYLGGSALDAATSVTFDSAGNTYVTGQTASSNFPTKSGAYQAVTAGLSDVFVTKLNVFGSALVYSTYVGGTANDYGEDVATDSSGNAYVTGYTASTNFPHTGPSEAGDNDAFVTKVNAAGTALVYSRYLGGIGDDIGNSLAVDSMGNVYVAGTTGSADFPLAHPLQGSLSGYFDLFIARLSPNADLLFSTYLGGLAVTYSPFGKSLALIPGGTVYVAGYTNSTDVPHPNALYPNFAGYQYDAVVAKIDTLPAPVQTVGAYDPASGTFYLRNSNSGGNADFAFLFGPPGCIPLSGDWTGKGYDSIGVYCPNNGAFYLRNSNTTGYADLAFTFGPPNCQPLVGDWTGRGYDSVGVDCNGLFHLRNADITGTTETLVRFGPASGCKALAGDWSAKGWDSIGIYCSGTFYLRNANTTGYADLAIAFGPPSGCIGETGDWTGKGYDSIGVDCAAAYYLRNSNTPGYADLAFPYGASSFAPLTGAWISS